MVPLPASSGPVADRNLASLEPAVPDLAVDLASLEPADLAEIVDLAPASFAPADPSLAEIVQVAQVRARAAFAAAESLSQVVT
ncbi:MAG: hypothetical protein JOZ18_07335 [Chloroflexi bacterium]|nr:hypothetical protein [Chloroflexota bacterium]